MPGKPESPATAAWSGAQRIGTWCVLSSELRDWQPGVCGEIVGVVCVNFEPVQEKAHHFIHTLPDLSWRHGGCCGSTTPEDVRKILPLLCQKCSCWDPAGGRSLAHRFVECFGPQNLRCQYGLAATLFACSCSCCSHWQHLITPGPCLPCCPSFLPCLIFVSPPRSPWFATSHFPFSSYQIWSL